MQKAANEHITNRHRVILSVFLLCEYTFGGYDMKKRITRFMSMILIAAMIVAGFGGFAGTLNAHAEETPMLIATRKLTAKVYVTLSDESGVQQIRQKSVDVTDFDEDGALTVLDALYAAHEKYFKGGAEAGFAYTVSDYGPFVTKILGIDNGGNFYFYLNNKSVSGLKDAITDGDYVNGYTITDTVTWSDKYTFFNKHITAVKEGKNLKLILYYADFDSNYQQVDKPLANARILINGKETDYVTNSKGVVKIKFDKANSYYVSAVSEDLLIAPPALLVSVTPEVGETIKVGGITYTVTKVGKLSGKKGIVTYSKALNPKNTKKVPKKIEFGMITYKVKTVDE